MDNFPWEVLLFSVPPVRLLWTGGWRIWFALWGLEDLLLWGITVVHRCWRNWQRQVRCCLLGGGPLLWLLLLLV